VNYNNVSEDTIRKRRENENYFVEELKLRVNEAERPKKVKSEAKEMFGGVVGSFKKLVLD